MPSSRPPLLLVASVALAAGLVAPRAQERPEVAPPVPTEMEERVLVQLVQMPITAVDRQGRPVVDLRAEELEIKLRRKRMTVAYLESFAPRAAAPADVPDVRLFLDAPGGWSVPATSSESVPRYVAFVVDNENDDPLRRQEAVEKAIEFLETRLEPGTRLAVLAYNGALHLELPFTTDRAAIKTSLLRATGREGRPRIDREAKIRRLLDRFEDCATSRSDFGNTGDPLCLRDVANEYIGEVRPRALDFIRGLDDLVKYLAGLQGRKEVYVLSHGLPVDPAPVVIEAARSMFGNPSTLNDLVSYIGFGGEARLEMDKLLESLVRNRITLSFVDRAAVPTGDVSAKRGTMLAPGVFPMRAEHYAAVADMEQIAYTSGGIHVKSTDVTAGLRDAFDARRGSYELGFQTDEYLDTDKLAKVTVDCTRPGVKILHRRGVYANPPQSEMQLRGGFAFGKNRPLQGARAPGVHQPFLIEVDAEQLGYEVGDTAAEADFTVHLSVLLASTGTTLADRYHFVSHAYERPYWDAPDRPPVTLSGWVELPPGEYTLRAWFRNVRNGREGVVTKTVAVPAPEASGNGKASSSP